MVVRWTAFALLLEGLERLAVALLIVALNRPADIDSCNRQLREVPSSAVMTTLYSPSNSNANAVLLAGIGLQGPHCLAGCGQ